MIGALWGEGVMVEVLLFALGAAVTRRVSPPMLFALGGTAAVLRWTVTGLTDALPLLVLVQALHAITFGAVHLGSIQYVLRAVPKNLSATAMSLYQGAIVGFTGITMLLAGPTYARFAGGAYLGMAALGGVGLDWQSCSSASGDHSKKTVKSHGKAMKKRTETPHDTPSHILP